MVLVVCYDPIVVAKVVFQAVLATIIYRIRLTLSYFFSKNGISEDVPMDVPMGSSCLVCFPKALVMFVQRLCNNTPEPLEYCYNYPVVLLQGLWNFFTEPYKIIKGKLLPILFS
jgi:hypothetical protein